MADTITRNWRGWPDADDLTGDMIVRLHFAEVSGRRICVGLEMWGDRPSYVTVPEGNWQAIEEQVARLREKMPKRRDVQDLVIAVGQAARGRPPVEFPVPPRELTSEKIRIKLQSVAQEDLQVIKQTVMAALAGVDDDLATAWRHLEPFAEPHEPVTGRPRYDDGHWREVAKDWNGYAKWSATPTTDVAHKYKVSVSAVNKWIRKCRDLNLIPPVDEKETS